MKRTQSKTAVLAINKKILWVLTIILGSLLVLYAYFVSQSILHVVVREEIEQKMISVNTNISELEQSYLSKKNTLNTDLAFALGYTTIQKKYYITRKTISGTQLTLNNETP